MGLLKAGAGALGGVLADQWREFFYCESLDADTLVAKGEKRVGKRSSNKKGDDNIISNGSVISMDDVYCYVTESKTFTPEEKEYILNSGDCVLTDLMQALRF